jgi:hypothetical protein
MFNEGDRVIHTGKLIRGEVLEIDGNTAYLEMDNGVEMDFPVSDLILESEYKTPDEIKRELDDLVDESKKKAAEVIWPKIRPVIACLVESYVVNRVEPSVKALGGSATPWNELSAYHKMNYMCALTGTTLDQWIDAADVGKLPLLQLTIMAQIGEAASLFKS